MRKWRDERGVRLYDLNRYCAVLAKEYDFVGKLNSQAPPAARGGIYLARYSEEH